MKKLVLMAAAIVAVSFASCGNKAANNAETEAAAVEEVAVVEEVAADSVVADTAVVADSTVVAE